MTKCPLYLSFPSTEFHAIFLSTDKNCFELFLSAPFLFWEIFHLEFDVLPFAVHVKLNPLLSYRRLVGANKPPIQVQANLRLECRYGLCSTGIYSVSDGEKTEGQRLDSRALGFSFPSRLCDWLKNHLPYVFTRLKIHRHISSSSSTDFDKVVSYLFSSALESGRVKWSGSCAHWCCGINHYWLFNTSSFCVVLKGSRLTASPSHCETVETQPRSQREQGSY